MSTVMTPPIDTRGQSPLAHLTAAQLEELAGEFDDRDRRYIEAMIEMQRRLAVIGRASVSCCRASARPPDKKPYVDKTPRRCRVRIDRGQ